jgi:hypothetical protein
MDVNSTLAGQSKRRDYDIDDAAAYLNRLIVERGGPLPRSVRLNKAHMWAYSDVGIVGE